GFVNVKVDRDERPALDELYMRAVQAFTGGHGGWPMTVFLTPEGRPFHGGTYLPPPPRMGMPSFPQVLEAVDQAYHEQPDEVERVSGKMTEYLRAASSLEQSDQELGERQLGAAVEGLVQVFDARWGGFGGAPKFPPHAALAFLLRMAHRGDQRGEALAVSTAGGRAPGG